MPGMIVGSRYVLVRPLAKGGMGSVWIARHRDLDVDVTLKFMAPLLVENGDLRARFEREAKVAARLRSRHIVQVFDYGVDDEMPYIAMELLRGESLADRITREGRLSVSVTQHILQQICKALRAAHGEQLVHRDIKPGNIFVALEDNEEVVKVLDFGIVKETSARETNEAKVETATGIAIGSVHYMSPEQIRSSRSVDTRSDLWSVAVILYKMLTGGVPFPGTNHGDVMVRVCTDPFTPPSFVVPALHKEMDAFFARALARDPAARYQSADELAAAFLAVASLVPSDELVQGDPSRGRQNTIKLSRPPMASLGSVDTPLGSVVQTQPFPMSQVAKEPSVVSAVLERTAGTFQAVTMPKANGGAMPSVPVSSAKRATLAPRVLMWLGALMALVGVGSVGFGLASRWGAGSAEAISAGASGSASVATASSVSTKTHVALLPSTSAPPMVTASMVASAAPKPLGTNGQTSEKTAPKVTGAGMVVKPSPLLPKKPKDVGLDNPH